MAQLTREYKLKCQVIGRSGNLDITVTDLVLLLGEEHLRRALDLTGSNNFQLNSGTITTASDVKNLPGGIWLEVGPVETATTVKSSTGYNNLKLAVKLDYDLVDSAVAKPLLPSTEALRQFLSNEDQLQQEGRYNWQDELVRPKSANWTDQPSLLGPPAQLLNRVMLSNQSDDEEYLSDDSYGSDNSDWEDSKYF